MEDDLMDNEIMPDSQEKATQDEEGPISSITYKNSEFLRDLIVTPL